jgi:hypothetical protein
MNSLRALASYSHIEKRFLLFIIIIITKISFNKTSIQEKFTCAMSGVETLGIN